MAMARIRSLSHVRSLDLTYTEKDRDRDRAVPPVPPLPGLPNAATGSAAPPPLKPDATTAQGTPNGNGNGSALSPVSAMAGPSTPLRNAYTHPYAQTHGQPHTHAHVHSHASPASMGSSEDAVLQSGWLLKKGRKKLQGYARRHFSLSTHGVLSYRLSPTQAVRGSRALRSVSVAASGKLRQITIDGGVSVGGGERGAEDEIWHLKCLSSEEWTMWMTAIRKFIVDPEMRSLRSLMIHPHSPLASVRAANMSPALRASSSLGMLATKLAHGNSVAGESRSARMNVVLAQMEQTMTDMDKLLVSAEEDLPSSPSPRRTTSFGLRSKKEGKDPLHPSTLHHNHNHNHSHKENGKEKEKDGFFGIFHRRPSQKGHISPVPSSSDLPTLSTRTTSSPTPSHTPSSASPHPFSPTFAALSASLHALRHQHAQLLGIVQEQPASRQHSRPGTVHEHDHEHESAVTDGPEGTLPVPAPFINLNDPVAGTTRRLSIITTASAATGVTGVTDEAEWFDADEDWDVEEIELDAIAHEGEGSSAGDSEDEDAEAEEVEVDMALQDAEDSEDEQAEEAQEGLSSTALVSAKGLPLSLEDERRRTRLPTVISGEEVSLWAVLRKNVGKDLSTVSFPVTFNEPLSLLQKLAEELEYADLLAKAVAAQDPVERMCLVAAYAVSSYASTHYRAARKPFNPMLGETFEDVRPLSRFVAEKVSHHPPVMASYAEGEGWVYWATSGGKNKFWGRSLEIIPTGTTHLKIGENHYQWQKPSSFMRNLVAGQKYIEHVGQMSITDPASQLDCVLDFKDGGFWGSSRNAVSGLVRSSEGVVLAHLEGSWHESFARQVDGMGDTFNVLWRANPMPPHAEQYYGFTTFAVQLNEILPSQAPYLPPTDSRLRPDQRALEEGKVEEAELEKARLEADQRRRRRDREELGKPWEPRWFRRVLGGGGLGQPEEWEFAGEYWEARERRQWDDPGLW